MATLSAILATATGSMARVMISGRRSSPLVSPPSAARGGAVQRTSTVHEPKGTPVLLVGRLGGFGLYGKIRNEQMGSSVRCTGNVHIGSTPTLAHKFCYIGFGFRKSPLPHNDASRSACPVTAHITPDVEKVSSYSPPLRTPPSLSSTLLQSTLPIPDSLLPSISLDIPSRERSTDCVCASPNPSPIIEYIRQVLPSPSPPLLLFSCVACRMPRRCPLLLL